LNHIKNVLHIKFKYSVFMFKIVVLPNISTTMVCNDVDFCFSQPVRIASPAIPRRITPRVQPAILPQRWAKN